MYLIRLKRFKRLLVYAQAIRSRVGAGLSVDANHRLDKGAFIETSFDIQLNLVWVSIRFYVSRSQDIQPHPNMTWKGFDRLRVGIGEREWVLRDKSEFESAAT